MVEGWAGGWTGEAGGWTGEAGGWTGEAGGWTGEAGGLGLRTARESDVERIVALCLDAFGPWCETGVRHVLDDPARGPGVFTVVLDGDRVVSTLSLLDETLRLDGVELPTGQVEWVATAPAYRRRGLVRAQFDRVHRVSAQRGDLVNLIFGVPYFYRRFGYEYALAAPDTYVVDWEADLAMPHGWEVREARPDDLPQLRRLHKQALAAAELVRLRPEREWALILSGPRAYSEQVLVGVHDGGVRASGASCGRVRSTGCSSRRRTTSTVHARCPPPPSSGTKRSGGGSHSRTGRAPPSRPCWPTPACAPTAGSGSTPGWWTRSGCSTASGPCCRAASPPRRSPPSAGP